MEKEPLASLPLSHIRTQIKHLQEQVAHYSFELATLEVQLHLYTQENLDRSPHGWYYHCDEDGSDVLCEAVAIDTSSLSLHIQYDLPDTTNDHQECWLHTPEELARFSWTRSQETIT